MEHKAPIAIKIPEVLEIHNDTRIDDYFWMRLSDEQKEAETPDEQTQRVLDYLNAENAYIDAVMGHTKDFQKSLFEEMKGRIKEQDESVPYKYNGYWYITKYEEGKDYPIYTRKKETLEAPEEIMFDCNEMATGHSYFKLSGINISPDNIYAAFGVDTVSRRIYTIQIKNLMTGEILPYKIENTTGGSTWANDNKTLFFTRKDEQTLRSNRIYKYIVGADSSNEDLIFEEKDETFYTFVYKTKSQKFLVIGSASTLTTEYSFLDANNPEGTFKVFQPRVRGLEYSIAHYKENFYIVTNADGATNFKLMKVHESATEKEHWEEVIAHRKDTLLEDIEIFKDFLVVSERTNGLNKINIQRWDGAEDYYLPFDNETYTAFTTTNIEFDTTVLRYSYNSLTTPSSLIDFDMVTRKKTILKEQEVLGGTFNKDNYTSERLWAKAEDGAMVPMSLVYRKDTALNADTPLLLYGYGSYGSTIDPYFSSVRLSLLDRGFVYVIAHIRGGEYLGRHWYDTGKLLKKKNTFTDFIACAKHLVAINYTSPQHLYAMGGSAGGLLMGAVVNMAEGLFNGVIAAVPFVDVVSTMLDESIPLTTGEFDEWGNPKEEDYYWYIKSYSPYDNVVAQNYPNMLVTTGYHDSQVQYWEPAKWVAKLRELKKDNNKLLLRTNMETGHGGASGRFESLKEVAEEYAFLLDLEGIK